MFIKYEAEVSSRVGGGDRGVVDFGKLFAETSEQKFRNSCAQLMPLTCTVSCFRKIQIGFTFLVPAHPDSLGKRAVKRVCVCVCVITLYSSQANSGQSMLSLYGVLCYDVFK